MLLFITIHKVTPTVYTNGTKENSMYLVPVISIIDAQNLVKIEVFATFIFCVQDHIKCVCQQIQAHSIYQNNPCVIFYPLISHSLLTNGLKY